MSKITAELDSDPREGLSWLIVKKDGEQICRMILPDWVCDDLFEAINGEEPAESIRESLREILVDSGRTGIALLDEDELIQAIRESVQDVAPLPEPQFIPGRRNDNRPHYYKAANGMVPYDVIDAWGLDFYEGNVVKYLLRWRRKDGIIDLKKARTYINEIIKRAEKP